MCTTNLADGKVLVGRRRRTGWQVGRVSRWGRWADDGQVGDGQVGQVGGWAVRQVGQQAGVQEGRKADKQRVGGWAGA